MNFLEKNLESIIFNEPDYCRARGLDLEPYEFRTYRQMSLAPFGIPDLIQIGSDPYDNEIRVRIIECKRNVIDLTTYAQAARYQTALVRILGCCSSNYSFEKVLIGQRIDPKNDFWHVVNTDPRCRAYTYQYLADGIHFKSYYSYGQVALADAADINRATVAEVFRVVEHLKLGFKLDEE